MSQHRLGLSKFRSRDLMGRCCAPHTQIGCHVSCQRQVKNKDGDILSRGIQTEQTDGCSAFDVKKLLDFAQGCILAHADLLLPF